MKKLISMISVLAMAVTMFTTTSLAAPTETSSNPGIVGKVTGENAGYVIMQFSLNNNETLSYTENKHPVTGKVQSIDSNGINGMQAVVKLDSSVFNISDSMIVQNDEVESVTVAGDGTDTLKYVYAPTAVKSYMTTVPEYLFQVYVTLKEGYTVNDIPDSAVGFGECIVEYKSYNNIATSADPSTYTIYAANPTGDFNYPLTTTFKGTAKETTEYTVTFKADDVEVSSVKVAENGTVATLPDAPAKDGYTFSKWVANGEEFTTSTVITADTTVTAEYTKNAEEKYGTPITEGKYAGKTLYLNEEGTTTFNFGTDKAIQITKKVGETTESRTFGKKWLSEKTGVEGEGNTTFTLGIIDVNDLAKGTFTFKVLQSLE